MKSPLRKFKKFGLHKSEPENLLQFVSSHVDGLDQAEKDVQDMKACYDALVSAAAATTNSAYEFSESLQELGNSLLEETVLHDNGETGEALLLLGRVQLELQKLFDSYRSQIISTVSNPSESFLTELRKVEEMKLQCDEKRDLFEHIVGQNREKGKARHGKLETQTSDQLKAVREEYDETAGLCIFRVQSLKKGQCRSLLTLAAHHHAAQLNFFRKGLQSLEAVDMHIRSVAERLRIDYQVNESNFTDEFGDGRFGAEAQGEFSFTYNMNKDAEAEICRVRNEVPTSLGKPQGEPFKAGSHSAPLYSEKFDPVEKLREMRPSAHKFSTHVLPTPDDAKGGSSTSSGSLGNTMLARGASAKNLWHSSPLDVDKPLPSHSIPKSNFPSEESSSNKHFLPLPPRMTETVPGPQVDVQSVYDVYKTKRHGFSGPLVSKSLASKPSVSVTGPNSSNEIYGSFGRPSSSQPLVASSVSHSAPPVASLPKVSELHELPRPPDTVSTKSRYGGGHRHSAPLINREREISPTRIVLSNEGSPLPLPHLTVSRSFSIPSSSNRIIFHSGSLYPSQVVRMTDEAPTTNSLTPLSPSHFKTLNSREIQGDNC